MLNQKVGGVYFPGLVGMRRVSRFVGHIPCRHLGAFFSAGLTTITTTGVCGVFNLKSVRSAEAGRLKPLFLASGKLVNPRRGSDLTFTSCSTSCNTSCRLRFLVTIVARLRRLALDLITSSRDELTR